MPFPLHSTPPHATPPLAYAIGIDESGRGPVLGPMTYTAFYIPTTHNEKLKELGVDDSKQLTPEKREMIFETLTKEENRWTGWETIALQAELIGGNMLSKEKYNLNAMSHDTAVELVRKIIEKNINVEELYVDTVGPPEKYQAYLQSLFPQIKCVVAKKADSLYPVVSAASIVAKVTRDDLLKEWVFKESKVFSTEFGSGYPGDPATKAWLLDSLDPVFGFPTLVRYSWSTCAKLLEDKAHKVEWFDVDEEVSAGSVANCFAPKTRPVDEKSLLGPKKVSESSKRWGVGITKSYFGIEFLIST